MLDNLNKILTLKGYIRKFPAYAHTNIWHVQKRTSAFYHEKYLYTSNLQQNYSLQLELHIQFSPFLQILFTLENKF